MDDFDWTMSTARWKEIVILKSVCGNVAVEYVLNKNVCSHLRGASTPLWLRYNF